MKKILCFTLLLAAAGVLVSCSGGASTPGKVARQYAEYLAAADYDRFIEGVYIDPAAPAEEIEQGKVMLRSLFAEKGAEMLRDMGGIKTVELVSEETAPDGQTARVVLKYTYGNGEISEDNIDMRRDESGKWKIDLKK